MQDVSPLGIRQIRWLFSPLQKHTLSVPSFQDTRWAESSTELITRVGSSVMAWFNQTKENIKFKQSFNNKLKYSGDHTNIQKNKKTHIVSTRTDKRLN